MIVIKSLCLKLPKWAIRAICDMKNTVQKFKNFPKNLIHRKILKLSTFKRNRILYFSVLFQMAERIFQVKTEMESTEDFIKVEHMDYILGTSTSEDKLSESNNAVHDPLKPDITEHDFSQESFISEHVSLKVESEDTTFTEVSDINNCDNSKIGAH